MSSIPEKEIITLSIGSEGGRDRTCSVSSCGDCIREGLSLEMVLQDTERTRAFREFLAAELCDENLLFWLECESFKHSSKSERRHRALHIWNTYIDPDKPAQKMVILPDTVVKEIQTRLASPKPLHKSLFSNAQQEIFIIMRLDPFPRFLKSMTLTALHARLEKSRSWLPEILYAQMRKECFRSPHHSKHWHTVHSHPFKSVSLEQKAVEDGEGWCSKAWAHIDAPAEQLHRKLLSLGEERKSWDKYFLHGEIVAREKENLETVYLVFKRPGRKSKFEMWIMRTWRIFEDGTILLFQKSITHPKREEKYQRWMMKGSGYMIEMVPGTVLTSRLTILNHIKYPGVEEDFVLFWSASMVVKLQKMMREPKLRRMKSVFHSFSRKKHDHKEKKEGT